MTGSKRNSSKAASQALSSREQEDNGVQMEEIVLVTCYC